jgi:hypothetical protein
VLVRNKKGESMKLGKLALAALLGTLLSLGATRATWADSSVGAKADEAISDTKRGAKKAGRNVKQKGCEMVNGKMECAGKAVKNKVKDAGDALQDAID